MFIEFTSPRTAEIGRDVHMSYSTTVANTSDKIKGESLPV
jgi:hypothetical protein